MQKSVSFQVTEDELASAVRRQYLRNLKSPRTWGKNAILFSFAGLLALGVNIMRSGFDGAFGKSISFLGVMFVFLPLSYLFGYWTTSLQAGRLFGRIRATQESWKLDWSDTGLEFSSVSAKSSFSWNCFKGWQQDDQAFSIFVHDSEYILLPRRAFSEEQWLDLAGTFNRSGLEQIENGQVAAVRPGELRRTETPPLEQRRFALWRRAGGIALLWLTLTLVATARGMLFPESSVGTLSNILLASSIPMILGFLIASIIRVQASEVALMSILFGAAIATETALLTWSFFSTPASALAFGKTLWTLSLLGIALVLWVRYRQLSLLKRGGAILAFTGASIALSSAPQSEPYFWEASAQTRSLLNIHSPEDTEVPGDPMVDIMSDTLWGMQSALVQRSVDELRPPVVRQNNFYGLAVAAGGTQDIFALETREALRFAARRFGTNYRGGVLLSNGSKDLMQVPLATQSNIQAMLESVSQVIDPTTDILFVYLASHGSRDAELQTDLPNYSSLNAISARSVAQALQKSGIRRRIIVVSACYSGSWIPALASPDTIVVTASRKDRTSFGCDDSLNLTLFGEAFLQGSIAKGGSLSDAFEKAREVIRKRESQNELTPSEPQVYVGKNMKVIWERNYGITVPVY